MQIVLGCYYSKQPSTGNQNSYITFLLIDQKNIFYSKVNDSKEKKLEKRNQVCSIKEKPVTSSAFKIKINLSINSMLL